MRTFSLGRLLVFYCRALLTKHDSWHQHTITKPPNAYSTRTVARKQLQMSISSCETASCWLIAIYHLFSKEIVNHESIEGIIAAAR